MNNGVIHVGLDLGTSFSAISASNGRRHLVESFVGWPVDMVARKVLQKEVVVGSEALLNQPMLDLRRPLERGLIKDGSQRELDAVREILRHLVSLVVDPEARRNGVQVRAVVGVPAEALLVNKRELRDALSGVVDQALIVSEPFAVAYGLEALVNTMVIDMGAGTTDFCVLKGRYPKAEDQRTLAKAGDAVDQKLYELVSERYPRARFSVHMARKWKEQHAFVWVPEAPVLVTAPVEGRPTELEITQEMSSACESLLPPVVEILLDLLANVEPEIQGKVSQNIILAGGSSQIPGFGAAVHEALQEVRPGHVRVIDDPVFAGSDGGLAIALDAPDGDWEQLPA